MITSETLTKLLPALLAAKKQFKPALKTAVNPMFRSKYVDLQSVVEATEDALLENGLMLLQTPNSTPWMEEKSVGLTTRLVHVSGEWMEETVNMTAAAMGVKDNNGIPTVRYDAQTVGSAITYARRYSYMGILGIAPEDDDGNVAPAHAKPAFKPNGKPAPIPDHHARVFPPKPYHDEPVDGPHFYDDEPVFDQNGDMVPATKVPPPAPPRYEPPSVKPASGPTITEAQAKRWFAICKASGKTEEEMKWVLKSIGVQRSKEIPKDQYDAFIEWAGGQNEARA